MSQVSLAPIVVVCILLLGLPASYNTLVAAFEAQAELPNLKFESMAWLNEDRKQECSFDTGSGSALLSQQEVCRGRSTKQKANKPENE